MNEWILNFSLNFRKCQGQLFQWLGLSDVDNFRVSFSLSHSLIHYVNPCNRLVSVNVNLSRVNRESSVKTNQLLEFRIREPASEILKLTGLLPRVVSQRIPIRHTWMGGRFSGALDCISGFVSMPFWNSS